MKKIHIFLLLLWLVGFWSCAAPKITTSRIETKLQANSKIKNPLKMIDYIVTIVTPLGEIDVLLFDETPNHKKNFLKLANEGFYDSTLFHRVIRDFMIQGGDPLSKDSTADARMIGTGGPGYTIPAENIANSKHLKGALAAARQGDQVNPKRDSSGSQFYIVHSEKGCKHLDGQYTVFGQVIGGMDIVDKIAVIPTGYGNRPNQNIRMTMKVKEMTREEISKTYNYQYSQEVK